MSATPAPLDFSIPHLLRSDAEYDAAAAEIDRLLARDPAPGTPDADRLELLTVLVAAYDDEHYPIPETTPQDVVDFLLEQNGMTRADLAPLFGGRSRVSDFFAGKRHLSLRQIQKLRERFHVSADALLPPASFANRA